MDIAVLLDEIVRPGGTMEISRSSQFPVGNDPGWELIVSDPPRPGSRFRRSFLRIRAGSASELVRLFKERCLSYSDT